VRTCRTTRREKSQCVPLPYGFGRRVTRNMNSAKRKRPQKVYRESSSDSDESDFEEESDFEDGASSASNGVQGEEVHVVKVIRGAKAKEAKKTESNPPAAKRTKVAASTATPSKTKKTPAKARTRTPAKASSAKKGDSVRKTVPNSGALKTLREEQAVEREAKSLSELGLEETIVQVEILPDATVAERIERLVSNCIRSIMGGNAFEFLVPSRAPSNQIYIKELDRIALKKSAMSSRSFLNPSTVRKSAVMARAMQLIHNIVQSRIHITKRELFYTDVKLFKDQKQSDAVLDDVACMVGCTRTSLNVIASEKGLVVGDLQFKEAGDEIDCSKMGIGGKGIPPVLDQVTDLRSNAKFVLLVEKDAAFIRLSEDRFYKKEASRCIIITAKGQPDVATRVFLRRLRDELKLPVLALMDSDPYGLKILSVYMSGSKNMSYDAASLTCPDIKWLGVRPSDLNKYNIPAECRLDMSPADMKAGELLLKEDFVKKNPEWVAEIKQMLKTKQKAEIQALATFGFQFLTESYLPQKIAQGDWI